jgi:hypothetical protein
MKPGLIARLEVASRAAGKLDAAAWDYASALIVVERAVRGLIHDPGIAPYELSKLAKVLPIILEAIRDAALEAGE